MAVTVDDVATTARRPVTSPEDVAAVRRWLTDVPLMIRFRYGADRAATLDSEAVDLFTREVVAARLLAPRDEATSTSYAVDDATVTRRWESSSPRGGSWIDDGWWAWLDDTIPSGTSANGAFTIHLAGGRGAW